MPKSALPQVSGGRSRTLAGKASPRTSSDVLCACGLHASPSFGPVGLAEQEGPLRSPVSHQCGNPSRSGPRSQTPRRRNRLLQRSAYLESEAHGPPTCPLRGASRWIVCRSHPLDQTTLRFLSFRRGAQSRLSRKVPRSAQARLSRRPAQLSWRSKTSRSTENICCVAETTVPKRLGGLLETP